MSLKAQLDACRSEYEANVEPPVVDAVWRSIRRVAETDLVATLPKSLVLRFGQTFGIRELTPSAPRVSIAVNLAWHERTEHDVAMRAFRDLVATSVRTSRKRAAAKRRRG